MRRGSYPDCSAVLVCLWCGAAAAMYVMHYVCAACDDVSVHGVLKQE